MRRYKQFLLRLVESCGGLKLLRWRNRMRPQVIMYHRITDAAYTTGLPPAEFEKQISYLANHFRVVSIETLVRELRTDSLQPYTVAVTFDDGHRDFYDYAWPILKKYNLPASLYVTTGFVNGDVWLWPDRLKYVMINSAIKQFTIAPLGVLSFEADKFSSSWNLLGDYCLTLTSELRESFINKLAQITECEVPLQPAVPFLPVTWSQLKEMVADGLDVGSHTVTHPILSGLNHQTITEELANSAQIINRELGYSAKGICYPNGRLCDINDDVIQCAEQCGYSYGLLARNYPITSKNQYLIGRLATNADFNYFKWLLNRHSTEQQQHYFN